MIVALHLHRGMRIGARDHGAGTVAEVAAIDAFHALASGGCSLVDPADLAKVRRAAALTMPRRHGRPPGAWAPMPGANRPGAWR